MQDTQLWYDIWFVLELLGTFAFAISGIRHAAAKKFDWFGGFVCAIAVAIGGGTLRDVLLGVTPFWMTDPIYVICTVVAQIFMIFCSKYMTRLDNAWFVFDAIGLGLFTVAGMEKTLNMGYPFWVAIIMGTITGSAGGVIRDVLVNQVPVIFRKEIYAMASVIGGFLCWLMLDCGVNDTVSALTSFLVVIAIRFLAVRYHISLPTLKDVFGEES